MEIRDSMLFVPSFLLLIQSAKHHRLHKGFGRNDSGVTEHRTALFIEDNLRGYEVYVEMFRPRRILGKRNIEELHLHLFGISFMDFLHHTLHLSARQAIGGSELQKSVAFGLAPVSIVITGMDAVGNGNRYAFFRNRLRTNNGG